MAQEDLYGEISRILNETRDQIRANMDAQHVNASGRTSASIRVEPYEGGIKLVGGNNLYHAVPDYPGNAEATDTAPIPTLEVGRAGGDVPRAFYYIIRQWSRDKGISFANETERNTFAYFVSRKIARQGTRRNKTHIDIYTKAAATARERINTFLQRYMRDTIKEALMKGIKVE